MTTDTQLLENAAGNADQQAFAEFVRRHAGWVRAAARRLVRACGTIAKCANAEEVTPRWLPHRLPLRRCVIA